jgi:hypothetical protein
MGNQQRQRAHAAQAAVRDGDAMREPRGRRGSRAHYGGPTAQGCTRDTRARTADSFKWAIACPAQGVTGTGSVRYTDKSMDSEIRMTVDMEGKKTEMFTKVSGRYLGPCKTK